MLCSVCTENCEARPSLWMDITVKMLTVLQQKRHLHFLLCQVTLVIM